MIQIPTLDELREVRRRLSEKAGYDVRRYAEMLRETQLDFETEVAAAQSDDATESPPQPSNHPAAVR